MDNKLQRLLLNAAVSLFGLVVICIIIKPGGLSANAGISYFGNYKETLLPYSGAFVLTAWFLYQLTNHLPRAKFLSGYVKQALDIVAILVIALILVPSNAGRAFEDIHESIGSAIFSVELILSIYWWLACKRDNRLFAFLMLEFFSGLASAFYLPTAGGFLLQAQLVYQAAFMLVLQRVLRLAVAPS